ncbi:MAG TPA: LCCL domain-containing protein [Gemmata sp.]|jgi:hypothetical protein|nr:LCCL domain-containing protein [Gemmata sp.]
MSAESDLIALDDLPSEARELIARTENAIAVARERADARTGELRGAAEAECAAIRDRAEAEVALVEQAATRELAPLVRELVNSLRKMQEVYAREGKLDEALAIRARIRQLRGNLLGVRTDPGNLTEFTAHEVGRTVLFEVVGRTDGSVWGTDAYTADSRLATAAVHAGALREGERGLVRVTLQDGGEQFYQGSTRHGVTSYDYGGYSLAYRVERV